METFSEWLRMGICFVALLVVAPIILPQTVRILREYQRVVVFRLGRLMEAELDELLSQRDKINHTLQEIIDRQTNPWGVKVTAVEVRDVQLREGMKRAMAKQAESERTRRAKIINAEGEFQAAEKLVQAAGMINTQPIALQLRFLQTMREISSEHNTTTFLPIPIDLFTPFLKPTPGTTIKG